MKNRIKALAQHLDCKKSEVVHLYDNTFEAEGGEYMVVTDEEADNLWEESLDNYLEDCIYPELTGNLINYFDDEAWKRDARYNGRGHSLSSYDGCEEEITLTDKEGDEIETFYIYRVN